MKYQNGLDCVALLRVAALSGWGLHYRMFLPSATVISHLMHITLKRPVVKMSRALKKVFVGAEKRIMREEVERSQPDMQNLHF